MEDKTDEIAAEDLLTLDLRLKLHKDDVQDVLDDLIVDSRLLYIARLEIKTNTPIEFPVLH